MAPKPLPLTRRAFLRLTAHLLPALFAQRLGVTSALAAPAGRAYGAGMYGRGAYAGTAVYLPIVRREGA